MNSKDVWLILPFGVMLHNVRMQVCAQMSTKPLREVPYAVSFGDPQGSVANFFNTNLQKRAWTEPPVFQDDRQWQVLKTRWWTLSFHWKRRILYQLTDCGQCMTDLLNGFELLSITSRVPVIGMTTIIFTLPYGCDILKCFFRLSSYLTESKTCQEKSCSSTRHGDVGWWRYTSCLL